MHAQQNTGCYNVRCSWTMLVTPYASENLCFDDRALAQNVRSSASAMPSSRYWRPACHVAPDASVALLCGVPYRIDIACPPDDALDLLVQLGALDIEPVNDGLAAIIPDAVTPDAVARALGVASVTVSPAVARDNGSVWLLSPRAVRIGSVLIAPPEVAAPPNALRLTDSNAFGTGHHPTTALCIEALEEALTSSASRQRPRRWHGIGRAGVDGADDGRAASSWPGHRCRCAENRG